MNEVENFLSEIDGQQWQATHTLFAVLDCAQLGDANWRKLHAYSRDICRPLFEGTADEGLSSVEPVLINARPPAVPQLLPWLLAQEKTTPMVLWLASRHPIEQVQQRLSSLLTVHLPDDPDALLRFYDPRVFNKLARVLSPAQMSGFFACADQWWTWDMRQAKRHVYVAPEDAGGAAMPLTLSEAQMQQFSQMDVADFVQDTQAYMVRNKARYRHSAGLSDQALAQQVGRHIDLAQKFGFESEQATTAYVRYVADVLGWTYYEGESNRIVAMLKTPDLTEDTKLERLQSYGALVHNPKR